MAKLKIADINKEAVAEHVNTIDRNAKLVDEIVDRIIEKYTKQLDDYMDFIKTLLADGNNRLTDGELEDITVNIPVLLYITGNGQEAIGVKEDVAKAFKAELYNKMYGEAEGTVADKQAIAELETRSELLVEIAYKRAYRKIKLKIDLANETLQSIKKVLTRRMQDADISKTSKV